MTDLEQPNARANSLCNRLDELANKEKTFCDDFSMQLEKFSWEMFRMTNDLKQIKEYVS